MKKEYDFSKGERGKFYHPSTELNIPVYLDPAVAAFINKVAKKKKRNVETIVNDWLKRDIQLIESSK